MVTRFAPSPTGRLHLGHAFAAKVAFNFAKAQNFSCLLRIEDIDHTRCTNEYTLEIYRELDWLGFDWPLPVKIQSKHYYDYAKIIKNLCNLGLAYECPLTRGNIRDGLLPKNKGTNINGYLDHFKEGNSKPIIPNSIRLDLKKVYAIPKGSRAYIYRNKLWRRKKNKFKDCIDGRCGKEKT